VHNLLWSLWIVGGAAVVLFAFGFVLFGLRMISEREAGVIVKRFGRPLPANRVVALDGEAGLQAKLLTPGWHFGYWHWLYKVQRVPLVIVPPGEIALVVAADGAPSPPNQILGREIACDSYQDAEKFLRGGGQRGRQMGILTAGTYRINPALFQVVRRDNATRFGTTADDLFVRRIPADQVGIVTALDGHPIAAGNLAGPSVPGHDSFQNGQAFVDSGGSRGLQEDILL
jgi:uncharacterized membrane protein YqiK